MFIPILLPTTPVDRTTGENNFHAALAQLRQSPTEAPPALDREFTHLLGDLSIYWPLIANGDVNSDGFYRG